MGRVAPEMKEAALDEMVRMVIRGEHAPNIAKMLGFNVNTIRAWMDEPGFKLKLARTRALVFNKTNDVVEQAAEEAHKTVEQMIDEALPRALDTLIAKLASSNEHVQLKAADSLLDRHDKTSKTRKVKGAIMHAVVTGEQLAIAARVAREIEENEAVGASIEAVALDESMIPAE